MMIVITALLIGYGAYVAYTEANAAQKEALA